MKNLFGINKLLNSYLCQTIVANNATSLNIENMNKTTTITQLNEVNISLYKTKVPAREIVE